MYFKFLFYLKSHNKYLPQQISDKNPVDCSVNLSHQLARNQSEWHFNARVKAHKMSDEFSLLFLLNDITC